MAEEKKDDIVIRPRRIEGILDDVYKDFFGGGQRPADYDWLGGGVPGIDLPAADSKKKTAAAPKAPDLSELDEIFKRSSMQNILAGTELAEKTAKCIAQGSGCRHFRRCLGKCIIGGGGRCFGPGQHFQRGRCLGGDGRAEDGDDARRRRSGEAEGAGKDRHRGAL